MSGIEGGNWQRGAPVPERVEKEVEKPAPEPTIEISDEFIDITDPNDEHFRSAGEPSAEAVFAAPMTEEAKRQFDAQEAARKLAENPPDETPEKKRLREEAREKELQALADAHRERIAKEAETRLEEQGQIQALRESLGIGMPIKERARVAAKQKVENAGKIAKEARQTFIEKQESANSRGTKPEDTTVN